MRLRLVLACLALGACTEATAPPTTPNSDGRSTSLVTASTTAPPAPTEETTSSSSSTTTQRTTTTTLSPLQGLGLETVVEGLSNPLLVTAPPGDRRLFVVTQPGRVRIISGGSLLDRPFLDVSGLVRSGGERGLLGLAFHPGYADNGRFFIHYTDANGDTALMEYRVSDDPSRADPNSARLLLHVDQPAGNHNGGMLAFGPEGYLHLALGDGGGAADTFGNGQRPDTLLATVLRLEVDAAQPYAIPPDNPFVDGGGAPEVWAYGLRNPWRFSFDQGLLYIADVGQSSWEEVNVVRADRPGLNYGWPIMEGAHCFQEEGCDTSGLVLPVLEYPIPEDGCAVIGGFVYRGRAIPELVGHYFYGDLCGGWVRSFRFRDGQAVDQRDWTEDLGRVGSILSLGRGSGGELYLTVAEGQVFRLVPRR